MLRQRCRSCGKLTHESIGSGSAHQEIFCIWLGVSNWDIVKHLTLVPKTEGRLSVVEYHHFRLFPSKGRQRDVFVASCCQNPGSPPFGKVMWNQETGGKIVFKKSIRSFQYKIKIKQIPHQGRIYFNQKKNCQFLKEQVRQPNFPIISVTMNWCHWR